MSETTEAPAPTRRRGKTAIDLAFNLPQALANTVLESLTPTQKGMISPADAGKIFSQCVASAAIVAEIVRAAEARTDG